MAREAEIAVFVARRDRSQILVLHRVPALGGYWHTVAGGIEPGEEPPAAALRELQEETGLEGAELGATVFDTYPLDEEPPETRARYAAWLTEMPVHSYLVDAPDDWEPQLDGEHDEYRWCPPEVAAATLRWPEASAALRDLLAP
ncbi:MAG TPA: NUDIX domain-containing protein [Gaiellaceae bacterium]|jgi:8-oxo-dGTP pyrophosphatase MutT (NUDIX family)|nr:NUDIX domain-containing protein [Gaiellaceae bacterium]